MIDQEDLPRESVAKGLFAALRTAEAVYFARGEILPHLPHSPVTRLIQGIYSREPQFARKILRNRIFASYQLTDLCRGMIRVAAKSVTDLADLSPLFESGLPLVEVEPLLPPTRNTSSVLFGPPWLESVVEMARATGPGSSGPRYLLNRPVAALLVSQEGELLYSASNLNAHDRTRHAEVNLIQGWALHSGGRPIPPGSSIYVSLKPCRMCAAMILHACEDPARLRVIYAQEDPGPMARRTALDVWPGIQEHR